MTEPDFFDRTETQLRAGLRRGANQPGATQLHKRPQSFGWRPLARGAMGMVRPRLLAAVAAGGTAVVGGIVAAILVLSSGASDAFADWSAVPASATTTQIAAAASHCNALEISSNEPASIGGRPVLSELRGIYTASIYVVAGHVYNCMWAHRDRQDAVIFNSFGVIGSSPAAGKVRVRHMNWGSTGIVPTIFQVRSGWLPKRTSPRHRTARAEEEAEMRHFEGLGYGDYTLGQVGTGITAVKLNFEHHASVIATVENGWYFAWWPWFTNPNSMTITTASGSKTSRMAKANRRFGGLPRPGCDPGAKSCFFTTS